MITSVFLIATTSSSEIIFVGFLVFSYLSFEPLATQFFAVWRMKSWEACNGKSSKIADATPYVAVTDWNEISMSQIGDNWREIAVWKYNNKKVGKSATEDTLGGKLIFRAMGTVLQNITSVSSWLVLPHFHTAKDYLFSCLPLCTVIMRFL